MKKDVKQKNSTCFPNRGFMTIEALIVSAIIVVSVIASTAVAQKSIQVSRQAVHTAQASFLLEEGAEAVRINRDNAWSNLSGLTPGSNYYTTLSGGTWTLSLTINTVGIFTRRTVITAVSRDATTGDIVTSGGVDDPGTKLVTIHVGWTEGGTAVSKSMQFYIMDIFS